MRSTLNSTCPQETSRRRPKFLERIINNWRKKCITSVYILRKMKGVPRKLWRKSILWKNRGRYCRHHSNYLLKPHPQAVSLLTPEWTESSRYRYWATMKQLERLPLITLNNLKLFSNKLSFSNRKKPMFSVSLSFRKIPNRPPKKKSRRKSVIFSSITKNYLRRESDIWQS